MLVWKDDCVAVRLVREVWRLAFWDCKRATDSCSEEEVGGGGGGLEVAMVEIGGGGGLEGDAC